MASGKRIGYSLLVSVTASASIVLIGLLGTGVLHAEQATTLSVYRCVGSDGAVALQDQPCPADSEQSERQVKAIPDSVAPSLPAAPSPAATPPPAAATPTAAPPPPLWRCEDYEGKTRLATKDEPNPRYVPLWVLGLNPGGRSGLAGRAGRPMFSQPAAAPKPPDSGRRTSQPLVYVQDYCWQLDPAAACLEYREQLSEANRLHYSRTGDERRRLQDEIERLQHILAGSCR